MWLPANVSTLMNTPVKDVHDRRQLEQQVGVKSAAVERLQEQINMAARSIEKLNYHVVVQCVCELEELMMIFAV